MPSQVKWSDSTDRPTGIAGAAINAGVRLLGDEIDAERDRFCSIELDFTHGTAPAADAPWSIWIVYALDGVNYEDGSDSVEPTKGVAVVVPARAVTTAQKQTRANIPLSPYKFKLFVKNGTAQNATGVTVLLRTHSEEIVG